MTETPDDADRGSTSEADEEDGRWFRSMIDPVLDAAPRRDGWGHVRDRVTGIGAVPMATEQHPRRPLRTGLLAAAAILAAVAAAGAVLILTPDDGPVQMTTDGGPDQGSSGFYLPTKVPEGWTLGSIYDVTNSSTGLCPCATATWTRDEERLSAVVVTGPSLKDASGEVDLGGSSPTTDWIGPDGAPRGWTARAEPTGYGLYAWERDGRTFRVKASDGVDATTVDTLYESSDLELATPDGYETTKRRAIGSDVVAVTEIYGVFTETDSDRAVAFQLSPDVFPDASVYDYPSASFDDVTLPGNGLALRGDQAFSPTQYFGSWPGGTAFTIGGGLQEARTDVSVTDEELQALADAFRPVSADEWKLALEADPAFGTGGSESELDVTRAALFKDRMADLVIREGDGGGPPYEELMSDGISPPEDLPTEASEPELPELPTATTDPEPEPEPEPADQQPDVADLQLRQFVEFAAAPGAPEATSIFAEEVELGLGPVTRVAVARDDLGDPAAWRLDADGFAARSGPISALDLVTSVSDLGATPGPVDTCFSNGIVVDQPFDATANESIVSIEPGPQTITSCIDWFDVVLTLDANGSIVAVNVFLVEP